MRARRPEKDGENSVNSVKSMNPVIHLIVKVMVGTGQPMP